MKRHSLVTAVYMIIEQNGKILIARRFNTGYADGQYSLVAGHVEKGESLRESAVRELKEEIGVEVDENELELLHLMYRHTVKEERLDVFFIVKTWQGEISILEPHKCDDLQWVSFDLLPQNCINYVKQAIEYGQKGILVSEFYE